MGKRESLCNTHPCRVFLSSHARHSRTCTRTPSLSPHQDPSTTRLSQGRDVRVWVGVCGHHRTGQPNKGSCVRRPAQFSEANSVGCRPYLCQRWTIPPRYQVTAWGRGGAYNAVPAVTHGTALPLPPAPLPHSTPAAATELRKAIPNDGTVHDALRERLLAMCTDPQWLHPDTKASLIRVCTATSEADFRILLQLSGACDWPSRLFPTSVIHTAVISTDTDFACVWAKRAYVRDAN